jgi:hypothetical protein
MAVDGTRTLRGALAGAFAAGIWAAQQPLDKRVFKVDYDDAALLGRFVARGGWVLPVGTAIHLSNGALLGAVYANLGPRLPVPVWLRGPVAGLAEHLATWPATCMLGRVPLRGSRDLPQLWGSPRAFLQGTWRHLLFGAVMGELERRMNSPERHPDVNDLAVFSSNGHGSVEHLAATGPSVG